MRVLLTGATGFVGRALARHLADAGHTVCALTRSPGRTPLPGITDSFLWNPTSSPPLPRVFEGVEGVVHLAGESVVGLWTASKREAIRESRVLGTRHLVRGLIELPAGSRPKVLVSASAIGYYGDRGEEELTESSPPAGGEDFLSSVCRAWEAEACVAESAGIRVVRPRIGIVLGEGGGALGAMLRPFRMGLGGPLGNGRQWWSWIHRGDLAGLVRFALENESLSGPMNATAPNPVRQGEFARELGRALDRPAVLPAPAFALRALLGGFSTELLSSKKVLPAAAGEAGASFAFPQLRGALEQILGRSG